MRKRCRETVAGGIWRVVKRLDSAAACRISLHGEDARVDNNMIRVVNGR